MRHFGTLTDVESYEFHLGITRERYEQPVEMGDLVFEGDTMFRNAWHAARIRPDGTGLGMFAGYFRDEGYNHTYGGAFTDDGVLFSNFFPMINMTEASGFGGIRTYTRGTGQPHGVVGVTTNYRDDFVSADPRGLGIPSFGIHQERYASEPAILPNTLDNNRRTGRMVLSMTSSAADLEQDYGLWVMDLDGANAALLVDLPGRSEFWAGRAVGTARGEDGRHQDVPC